MSLPLYTFAMLLTGTPGNPGVMPTALQVAPVPADQPVAPPVDPQTPVAPVVPAPVAPAAEPVGQDGDDIIVMAKERDTPGDPLAQINAQSFAATQAVDKAIVAPAASAYRSVLPQPIRAGISNFLTHLREPAVFLNFLLQAKVGKAAETLGRFAINSTIGVVGVFDIAKRRPFKLPHRRNGFANTMGFYGIKSGPFLFLPLIGPTTLRDFFGDTLDRLLLPTLVGKPFNKSSFTLPVSLLSAMDFRSEFDGKLKQIRAQSDPYTAAREYYLYRRQAEIDHLRGRHPTVGGTLTRPVDYPIPESAKGDARDAPVEVVPVPDAGAAPAAPTTASPAPAAPPTSAASPAPAASPTPASSPAEAGAQ